MHPSRRRNQPDLRIEFHFLFRLGLLARVGFDVLRRVLPAGAIPCLVIVLVRAVLHTLAPIAWMKRHRIAPQNLKNRNPPIQLAHRRGIPGIAMRMECVCDAGSQISIRSASAHARHVEIRRLQIAAKLLPTWPDYRFDSG